MKRLHVFVIIPCLNEEGTLASTCLSLGFGRGDSSQPQDTILIIVDNGSRDSTISIAEKIKADSNPDSVIIATESVRGYIPPRHHGVKLAQDICLKQGYSQDDVLILQADADTIYSSNYVDCMRSAALKTGRNVLLEAGTRYPSSFVDKHKPLINHLSIVENGFSNLFSQPNNDVIVDDKTCGYSLTLYTKSGGLRREFFANGDEVHAGTSRWFMRLLAIGIKRHKVEAAYVIHSVRKMNHRPLILVANAGFTREASWNKQWQDIFSKPATLKTLMHEPNHKNLHTALEWRVRNLIALFCLLPRHHARSISVSFDATHPIVQHLLKKIPHKTRNDVISNPASLMWDVFNTTDRLRVNIKQPSIDEIPISTLV